jgi:serine/threonine protein kinase
VWIAYTWVLVYSRFNLIKEVGDGTFGSVWRAINKQTGEVVSVLSFIATRIFSNVFL